MRILCMLIACSLAVACKDKDSRAKNEIPLKVKVDSSKIRKDEAVALLNEMQGWMEKGLMKKLSKNKVNKEINPRMERYQKLLKKMNKQDSTEVQDYRIKLINELIDLQIQQK